MSSAAKKPLDNFADLDQIIDGNEIDLSRKMYDNFAKKIYDLAGVDLPYTPKNVALIRNRIVKVLRRKKLDSYEAYWQLLTHGSNADINEFISAMTTNMTSFFREANHFEWLAEEIKKHPKHQEMRIWCAAASTGQEPYTLSIVTAENTEPSVRHRFKILATDIDLQVLKKGSIGSYEEKDMSGLSSILMKKYFEKMKAEKGEYWKAKDEIRDLLTFAQFNLMNEKYEFKNKFNIIFCRNVLIYFDEATTKKVIHNLVSCLGAGGYLVLGHSESGNIKHPELKPLSRAIYQKIG